MTGAPVRRGDQNTDTLGRPAEDSGRGVYTTGETIPADTWILFSKRLIDTSFPRSRLDATKHGAPLVMFPLPRQAVETRQPAQTHGRPILQSGAWHKAAPRISSRA